MGHVGNGSHRWFSQVHWCDTGPTSKTFQNDVFSSERYRGLSSGDIIVSKIDQAYYMTRADAEQARAACAASQEARKAHERLRDLYLDRLGATSAASRIGLRK